MKQAFRQMKRRRGTKVSELSCFRSPWTGDTFFAVQHLKRWIAASAYAIVSSCGGSQPAQSTADTPLAAPSFEEARPEDAAPEPPPLEPSPILHEEASEATPSALYWEQGRGFFTTPPYVLPGAVPETLVEPQPHPDWIERAVRRGEMFVPNGDAPNQTCLRWRFRGNDERRRATSDAFVAADSESGERIIRLVYSVRTITEPLIVVADAVRARRVLQVTQMAVEFSGPNVQERDERGQYRDAEEQRCFVPYALVGGDDVSASVVPTMRPLRAYEPGMERHWYRTLDACEAAIAREAEPGSLLCD